jgi:hypothetical protein
MRWGLDEDGMGSPGNGLVLSCAWARLERDGLGMVCGWNVLGFSLAGLSMGFTGWAGAKLGCAGHGLVWKYTCLSMCCAWAGLAMFWVGQGLVCE